MKNPQNGQSRGGYAWAFITFDNPLAASTAMERVNMNNTFGLHVKLAMSEQEKALKKMTEQEKEFLILDQQKRLEAFEKTKGIGHQNYPVEEVLGPMEGKAAQLKVSIPNALIVQKIIDLPLISRLLTHYLCLTCRNVPN